MTRRGEVWWADLPPPRGSGPGFRRPVLVIQAEAFNRSSIATVVVAVITSNVRLADAPGNVRVRRRSSRLARDSVVNVSQLVTFDRAYLTERISRLPESVMRQVNAGLRLVLAL